MVISVLVPDPTCQAFGQPSSRSDPMTSPAFLLAAPAGADSQPEVTLVEARAWLMSHQLLTDGDSEETAMRRYKALSKCKFGAGVDEAARREFLRRLIPHEHYLAAK